jgi:hypothetical protein
MECITKEPLAWLCSESSPIFELVRSSRAMRSPRVTMVEPILSILRISRIPALFSSVTQLSMSVVDCDENGYHAEYRTKY